MMAEELKPVSFYRPGRLRPVNREDREENEQRFHKKLSELADEQGEHPDGEAGQDDRQPAEQKQATPPETPPGVGGNLDVST